MLIIPYFKNCILEIEDKVLGAVIFQIFLFSYYTLHYRLYFYVLREYSDLLDNSKESRISIIWLSKYYLIEALCSSLPAAICVELNSIGSWLGILNFIYQVLVLYDSDFNILRRARVFLFSRICKIKEQKLDEQDKNITKILIISLNQIIIIIYLHLMLWYWQNRCLYDFLLAKSCDFLMVDYVVIRLENIFILLLFTVALAIWLEIRKKKQSSLLSNKADHSDDSLWQIYHNILFHFVVDHNLQYFMYYFYYNKMDVGD